MLLGKPTPGFNSFWGTKVEPWGHSAHLCAWVVLGPSWCGPGSTRRAIAIVAHWESVWFFFVFLVFVLDGLLFLLFLLWLALGCFALPVCVCVCVSVLLACLLVGFFVYGVV